MNKDRLPKPIPQTPKRNIPKLTSVKNNKGKQLTHEDGDKEKKSSSDSQSQSFTLPSLIYSQLSQIDDKQIQEYEAMYQKLSIEIQKKKAHIKQLKQSNDEQDQLIRSLELNLSQQYREEDRPTFIPTTPLKKSIEPYPSPYTLNRHEQIHSIGIDLPKLPPVIHTYPLESPKTSRFDSLIHTTSTFTPIPDRRPPTMWTTPKRPKAATTFSFNDFSQSEWNSMSTRSTRATTYSQESFDYSTLSQPMDPYSHHSSKPPSLEGMNHSAIHHPPDYYLPSDYTTPVSTRHSSKLDLLLTPAMRRKLDFSPSPSDGYLSPPPLSASQQTTFSTDISSLPNTSTTQESSISIYNTQPYYCKTLTHSNKTIKCIGYGLDLPFQEISFGDQQVHFYGNIIQLSDHCTLSIREFLGMGGYSIVFKCDSQSNDSVIQSVAIKINKYTSNHNMSYYNHIIQERERLKYLHHPYFIQYISDLPKFSNEVTGYVMEYIEGESLTHYIQRMSEGRQRPGLTETEILPLLYQLVQALNYLEDIHYVHLDIKPDNILLTSEMTIKLIDFGSLSPTPTNTNVDLSSYVAHPYMDGFTVQYAAPEVVNNSPVQRSDIYSLGATMYHMVTGKHPRENATSVESEMNRIFYLTSNDILLPEEYTKNLSSEFLDVYNQCLQLNFEDRPHASQLVQHPLFYSFQNRPLV